MQKVSPTLSNQAAASECGRKVELSLPFVGSLLFFVQRHASKMRGLSAEKAGFPLASLVALGVRSGKFSLKRDTFRNKMFLPKIETRSRISGATVTPPMLILVVPRYILVAKFRGFPNDLPCP